MAVNEGSSEIGIHHDPPCPLPALICGPGLHRWGPTGWEATGCGGRLFLADGLFDLSYGPRDVVLLDGNLVHGVTKLGDLPGQVQMWARAQSSFDILDRSAVEVCTGRERRRVD